jgi:hypothetical protein
MSCKCEAGRPACSLQGLGRLPLKAANARTCPLQAVLGPGF